ncbi:MAG: hypothetical protein ABIK93_03865, partial [candidate division WOR-3 bacterium]
MNRYIITIIIALTLVWAVKTTPINSQNPIINIQTQSKAIDSPEILSIPLMLNYQGKLTDETGTPVIDSIYSITFRLFTDSTGGTAYWNETQNIQTNTGLFNCLLGIVTPIPYIPTDANLYLEMQVNPNPAMTPRIRIVSSAYAYLSRKADSASYATTAGGSAPTGPAGGDLTGTYPNPTIANNAVNSAKIADREVTNADL